MRRLRAEPQYKPRSEGVRNLWLREATGKAAEGRAGAGRGASAPTPPLAGTVTSLERSGTRGPGNGRRDSPRDVEAQFGVRGPRGHSWRGGRPRRALRASWSVRRLRGAAQTWGLAAPPRSVGRSRRAPPRGQSPPSPRSRAGSRAEPPPPAERGGSRAVSALHSRSPYPYPRPGGLPPRLPPPPPSRRGRRDPAREPRERRRGRPARRARSADTVARGGLVARVVGRGAAGERSRRRRDPRSVGDSGGRRGGGGPTPPLPALAPPSRARTPAHAPPRARGGGEGVKPPPLADLLPHPCVGRRRASLPRDRDRETLQDRKEHRGPPSLNTHRKPPRRPSCEPLTVPGCINPRRESPLQ